MSNQIVDFSEWSLFRDLRANSRDPDDRESLSTTVWQSEPVSMDDIDMEIHDPLNRESLRLSAVGEPIDRDHFIDLLHEARKDGWTPRKSDWWWIIHPRLFQAYIRRESKDGMFLGASLGPNDHIEGIPVKQDSTFPSAALLLLDPRAVSLNGEALHPDRIYRMTGLTRGDD